jgi:hypothetical protein
MKHVSVKSCQFILCHVKQCKCTKINYIVLCGSIKQCKYKNMILHDCKTMHIYNNVKNVIFTWGGEIS